MSLRTVEVYSSYQGEGPQTGEPTTFVRFAGCNLKCPLWPCDTQHAIDPKIFGKTQVEWTPMALANFVDSLKNQNVCLTGGEVFLQHPSDLQVFVDRLVRNSHVVEVFTNGTLPVPAVFTDGLIDSFILDYKLPGSGELLESDPRTEKYNKNRNHLLDALGQADAVKFTIANSVDFQRALEVYEKYLKDVEDSPQVYAGVVWGKLETHELVTWMQTHDLSWKLNVQTHKFIWHPDKVGV
jgi:7-carboxy-7-deazaguanine synthase